MSGQVMRPQLMGIRLALVLWLAGAASAQSGAGMITGTLFEPSGATFPAAVVRARNAASTKVYEATSGPKGEYTLTGVAPGAYVLTVLVRGEQVHSQADVMVKAAQPSHIDIHLQDPGQL